jgi:S1-C subfamily serine protease
MFKNIRFLLVLIVSLFFISCATPVRNSQKKILPRESFTKIEKLLVMKACDTERCGTAKYGSTASGAVVRNTPYGSYVLTAEHVCDASYIIEFANQVGAQEYSIDFKVVDIEGNKFDVKIVNSDAPNDICLLWVENFYRKSLAISPKSPEPGDRAYNIAAPLGIFSANMIPIFDGYYSGKRGNKAFYSIPAAGGSSGSPVLNHKGELVGMIHSVYTRFANVSISPTYSDLTNFLESNIKRHSALYVIDVYTRVLAGMRSEIPKK